MDPSGLANCRTTEGKLVVKGTPSVSENLVDLCMMNRNSIARLKSQDGKQKSEEFFGSSVLS